MGFAALGGGWLKNGNWGALTVLCRAEWFAMLGNVNKQFLGVDIC